MKLLIRLKSFNLHVPIIPLEKNSMYWVVPRKGGGGTIPPLILPPPRYYVPAKTPWKHHKQWQCNLTSVSFEDWLVEGPSHFSSSYSFITLSGILMRDDAGNQRIIFYFFLSVWSSPFCFFLVHSFSYFYFCTSSTIKLPTHRGQHVF